MLRFSTSIALVPVAQLILTKRSKTNSFRKQNLQGGLLRCAYPRWLAG